MPGFFPNPQPPIPTAPLYSTTMGFSSFKLFRLLGISVFLHWSWFFMAAIIVPGFGMFSSLGWKIGLFVSLFGIVLIHEFGHALACKSVGGRAERIVLWPLGGVAFVQPPQRPGAVLWSIIAGPLVNVVLVPITIAAYFLTVADPFNPVGNFEMFMSSLVLMNLGLLIFNMLPIYPLDGGQVLMSILWYIVGRARAMQIVGIIGLIGAGLGVMLAVIFGDIILLLLAGFVAFQAWIGYRNGLAMSVADPSRFDERYAKRKKDDEVERKLQTELDPWR